MREINFSVMSNQADVESAIARYEPLVKAFEQKTRIHVNVTPIGWQNGWSQLLNFGLYGKGPDVSELGSTWVTSLAALQALRPIAPSEIEELGGGEAFFPPSWQANFLPGDSSRRCPAGLLLERCLDTSRDYRGRVRFCNPTSHAGNPAGFATQRSSTSPGDDGA